MYARFCRHKGQTCAIPGPSSVVNFTFFDFSHSSNARLTPSSPSSAPHTIHSMRICEFALASRFGKFFSIVAVSTVWPPLPPPAPPRPPAAAAPPAAPSGGGRSSRGARPCGRSSRCGARPHRVSAAERADPGELIQVVQPDERRLGPAHGQAGDGALVAVLRDVVRLLHLRHHLFQHGPGVI